MTETWYVLDSGGFADPRDVVTGEDGRLEHKDGRKVAYAPYGPRTRSVNPVEMRRTATPIVPVSEKPKTDAQPAGRDMKPAAAKRGYTTRQSRAD